MREAARCPKLLTAACSTAMQCVVRTNPETQKWEVGGTHWDFDSYGGFRKRANGEAAQVESPSSTPSQHALAHL